MSDKFHERFEIEVDLKEAKRRFINRAHNELLSKESLITSSWEDLARAVANRLGEEFDPVKVYRASTMQLFTQRDLYRTLQAIEAVSEKLRRPVVDQKIQAIVSQCEIDIGVRWFDRKFFPSGAKELDQALVNEPVRWLRSLPKYKTGYDPFVKALTDLLRSQGRIELLQDVITDAYEALEAVAKIVTGKDTKLDANRELFLSVVKASNEYKRLLSEYCDFAHNFRHGAAPGKKPQLTYPEAESFVYLTGLFIRFAVTAEKSAAQNEQA